jgi:hypothetical protein
MTAAQLTAMHDSETELVCGPAPNCTLSMTAQKPNTQPDV